MLKVKLSFLAASLAIATQSVHALPVHFETNPPDGKMAMASHPASGSVIETEAADDFVLTSTTAVSGATFEGLLPYGASEHNVEDVVVEIYRVFDLDSNQLRTPNVPTRTNSPSDIAFDERSFESGNLRFTASIGATFSAANSVSTGIHPSPAQNTKGDGAVTGQQALFKVNFSEPFLLPPGHYFFVPQVKLSSGLFYWLSAPKPIVAPGTPFTGDLQAWIRNEALAPDWLRVGTDIVGGTVPPTFNATFSLDGDTDGTVHFQTGPVDGLMAMASHPPAGQNGIENEAADDFVLDKPSSITHAAFTGLVSEGTTIQDIVRNIDDVAVEIYRVFPNDSDTTRTPAVPTRGNSPADNAFGTRESATPSATLHASIVLIGPGQANNSVSTGIAVNSGGDGAVSGQEITVDVVFDPPFALPDGHYFFVPQVGMKNGVFFWLSAPFPNTAPGGTPINPDLQAWIRNSLLDPDWLRVGTDIVGGATPPKFNGAFSLDGRVDVVFKNAFE